MKLLHYATLGIEKDAHAQTIYKAYEELLGATPPFTKEEQLETSKRRALIYKAYEVLGNQTKRKTYDAEAGKLAAQVFDAIQKNDIPTLKKLNSQFATEGYNFDSEDLYCAHDNTVLFNWLIEIGASVNDPIFFTHNKQPKYLLETLMKAHCANPTAEKLAVINLILTTPSLDINQPCSLDYITDSKDKLGIVGYYFNTTALGLAMFLNDKILIEAILKLPNLKIDITLLIGSKPMSALHFAAIMKMDNVILKRIDPSSCEKPLSLNQLNDLINFLKYNPEANHLLIRNLQNYVKEHYRYNPLTFSYNPQWHEHLDLSLSATIKDLSSNFVESCKTLATAICSWDALINHLYVESCISFTSLYFNSLLMINNSGTGNDTRNLSRHKLLVGAWGLGISAISLTYIAIAPTSTVFLRSNVNPIFDTLYDATYNIGLKVRNLFRSKGSAQETPNKSVRTQQANTIDPKYVEQDASLLFRQIPKNKWPLPKYSTTITRAYGPRNVSN